MERIVGGKRNGVDGIPLGNGMPNSRGRAVVGWVNHADFVIPAWSVLVGEDDSTENEEADSEHEEMEQWKEGASKIVEAHPKVG